MGNFSFRGNVIIFYRLKVLTGLHIGGSKDSFEIGGVDNPVIKLSTSSDSFSFKSAFENREIKVNREQPYIPGSSIKGKLRSLLEWQYRDIHLENPSSDKFGTSKFEDIRITKLFGAPADSSRGEPVRIRVFDAYPVKSIETELKSENSINRITSVANPRSLERVPAGSEFEGKIVIKIFSREDAELLKSLAESFSLLEDDYLGGGGSRGSGKIKFEQIKIVFRDRNYYSGKTKETVLAEGDIRAIVEASKELPGRL
jgi:CRISPR-associated protein Csm3